MTEALTAVLDFLLNEVGFKEVQATYVSLNPASGKSWKRQECSIWKPSLMPFNEKDIAGINHLFYTESLSIG